MNTMYCSVSYKKYKKQITIYHLYVHPRMRRKGIATMLMQSVIEEIKQKHPGAKIVIEAVPFSDEPMNAEQLKTFYSKFDVEILNK